jgi:hypothetical protein
MADTQVQHSRGAFIRLTFPVIGWEGLGEGAELPLYHCGLMGVKPWRLTACKGAN